MEKDNKGIYLALKILNRKRDGGRGLMWKDKNIVSLVLLILLLIAC